MTASRLVGFVSMLLIAAAAQGASIGINFVGSKPDSEKLAPDAKAGLDEVAQDHWNNFHIASDDPNGHGNHDSLKKLVDDSGKAVDGMAVNAGGTPMGGAWAVDGASWGFSGDNLTLQSGELHGVPQITITGIPYAKYDVYVYFAAGDNGGQASVKVSVAAGGDGKVASPDKVFLNVGWNAGKWVEAKATSLDDAKKGSADYAVFSDNTAKSITIDLNGTLGGGWVGISGIQIVEKK